MPDKTTRSVPEGATQDPLVEALCSAYDEEFELFASQPQVRRAVRASIAGKVKRRTVLRLGFAQGCKVGNMAAGYMNRAQLALALGIGVEDLPEWSDLMAAVRKLNRDGEASS